MSALPRSTRAAACASLALMAACGVTDPVSGRAPGIHFVAVPMAADTIDARPVQALVAELRDDKGNAISGAIVRFEAQAPDTALQRGSVALCRLAQTDCFYSPIAIDTTDSQGRVRATLNLGKVPGTAKVFAIAQALNKADTAQFTVLPGAPARVRLAFNDTVLEVNGTATVRAIVLDRHENLRTDVATLSTGAANTITLATATGVITARDFGTQSIYARLGSLADSTTVRVVPQARIVAWARNSGALNLVNLNGSNRRTVVANAGSDGGVFPHFDATRQRVVYATGSLNSGFGGQANKVIIVDTSGTVIRQVSGLFTNVSATRLLADGTLLVVGLRAPGVSQALYRVAQDNSLTLLSSIPELEYQYGDADISPDGSRVAFLAATQFKRELRVLTVGTGAILTLAPNARSPRWSGQGDRIAFLVSLTGGLSATGGSAATINPDGTGIRIFGPPYFYPGIGWSSDDTYLMGSVIRDSEAISDLRVLRLSDGASVVLKFRGAAGDNESYTQPDWR